ncbi:HNH endonuclease family protein [Nitrosomonas ureae]|uniref:GmrSD restriction endonucleases C-terminal domain-containing protein n=1 Tax=Nitrosomonas ureae TaxID=44577 RepID=A0A286A1X8_9PROT|nr:HNH endonuclease family protein [Nitrosomonas ureae]SOD15913.1 Protein of unknown function [Nitrosomonas ureae]
MKITIINSPSIIIFITVIITLSSCAIEKREFPVTQQQTTTYHDQVTTSTPQYNRKDWPHWINADGDCQDTRQEVLIAASMVPLHFKDSKKCAVIYGEWYGAYTGKTFTNPSDLDIDHIVPLAHAHRHGAENWTKELREFFANDIENLIAVSNSKSDKASHEWLPPLKSYWCEYGKRWERVKEKYQLWYSEQERIILNQLAETCFE